MARRATRSWSIASTVTVRKQRDKDGKLQFGLTGDQEKQQLEETEEAVGNALKEPDLGLAHPNSVMACYTCHTSWNTSCFGCHLPMKANQKKPMLHNEG